MAKKPLKSQLNQIRAWAREGRTDAWIAHQLDVSASELRGFRKRHGLEAGEEAPSEDDLRDAIEAEIEAAALAEPEDEEEEEEEEEDEEDQREDEDGAEEDEGADGEEPADTDQDARPRRRRRRRRRGGGGRRPGVGMEASFDHGKEEGYGLWLDPAVADDPIYAEHWKGHEAMMVTVEPDQIIIRRAGAEDDEA